MGDSLKKWQKQPKMANDSKNIMLDNRKIITSVQML